MKENWRDVVGYEGIYEVSDYGCVRKRKGKKVRYKKCSKDKKGYSIIYLSKNGKGKCCFVHRLVYESFRGRLTDGYEIDHINTVRDDNRLENLRAVTPKENCNNPITRDRYLEAIKKLTSSEEWRQKNREANRRRLNKPVLQLDKDTGEVIRKWQCASDAERELGMSHGNIGLCCHGRQKTAGGFKWKFA